MDKELTDKEKQEYEDMENQIIYDEILKEKE
jgi:hypothetical protein